MDKFNIDKEDLNLIELINIFLKRKYLIFFIVFISAILSVIYSLSLPNIYTSRAILVEANQQNTLSSRLGGITSFANVAGVSLPGQSSKTEEAIERIKSYEFFSKHFLPYIKLENLMAVNRWDEKNNTISYKKNLFNQADKEWVRKIKPVTPSNQQAYRKYKEIISVSQDNKTGFVSLSIKHESPHIAKEWMVLIIQKINFSMRMENDKLAKKSIDFLTNQLKNTNIKETRDAITSLIESQMQNLMVAAVSESYAFRVLESPIAPEKKTSPSRAIICIIGTILGGIFALIIALFIHFKNIFND